MSKDFLNLTTVSKVICIESESILEFLKLRGYIQEYNGEYMVTVLGYERDFIQKNDEGEESLTPYGIKRLIQAFCD